VEAKSRPAEKSRRGVLGRSDLCSGAKKAHERFSHLRGRPRVGPCRRPRARGMTIEKLHALAGRLGVEQVL
jgi:hypothetical protein